MTAPAGLSHSEDAGAAPPPRLGPLVQYALLAGPLLSMLDSSIVNVAVEPIARELHASLTTVQWTVSGYLLALGAGLAGTAYLARRSLWLIALILACRSVSIGLVINPLLQALTEPLRPDQLGDANTLFNTWQRIAGSFGIGLLAALYAAQSRAHGPVSALHLVGVVLAVIAGAGVLASLALPALPNTPSTP